MRHLLTLLERFPRSFRLVMIGSVLLLGFGAIWFFSSNTSAPNYDIAPVFATPEAWATTQPRTTTQPRATTDPTQFSAARERYLAVAQRAAPANSAGVASEAQVAGKWHVRVLDTQDGTAVVVVMPLERKASKAESISLAKQRMTQVVNALFVDDPSIVRLGVIGMFQDDKGQDEVGVSMFIRQAASPQWGSVTLSELERIAQSVYVAPFWRRP